jgi:RimJ/RimL family protein N-acetyltransferase
MVIVRDLRPSDFADIVDYYYRFYDEVKENPSFGIVLFRSKPPMSDELAWFSGLYKGVAEGRGVAVVAEIQSHVVGLCEAKELRLGSDVSHRAELGISVSREHRGMGVGTALLQETLERCKGKFEIIELSLITTNQVARRLYEKFGFKSFGIRPRSIKRGDAYFDEELMRLDLRAQG